MQNISFIQLKPLAKKYTKGFKIQVKYHKKIRRENEDEIS